MAKIQNAQRILAALTLAGGALLLGRLGAGHAATTQHDELKPLYAMASDIAEGKQLAAATCAKCHGLDGIAATKEAPNLAGQRPSYLYLELKEYQAQHRTSSDMYEKVKFLSEDAIVKVAAYYASLDPAQPPTTPAPKIIDPVEAGKTAAAPCAKCHGDDGISHKPGVPNLVGLGTKYFLESAKAYKEGDRKIDAKNEEMTKSLEALDEKQLGYIALYYGLKDASLTHAQTPIEGDASALTKDMLANCVKCHGEDGVATSPASPSIAGQESAYMLKALHAYKDGSRDDDVMGPRAKKLAVEVMPNFVAYYANLQPKAPDVRKPLSAGEWAEKCDHCHGANGNSARPDVPALASQKLDYLATVLRAYRSGERHSSEMSAMSSILTDDDINGIASYYAYQKARPAVFVAVPK
jgi:cytochrome c553